MTAIIKKSVNGQFYFVLHARNGKVVATGETYKRRSSVIKTLKNLFPSFTIIIK